MVLFLGIEDHPISKSLVSAMYLEVVRKETIAEVTRAYNKDPVFLKKRKKYPHPIIAG